MAPFLGWRSADPSFSTIPSLNLENTRPVRERFSTQLVHLRETTHAEAGTIVAAGKR
jgi:hypothetical protein